MQRVPNAVCVSGTSVGNRAEPMIGGLVQLGAAAITPLVTRQHGPGSMPLTPPAGWLELAWEALEQSRRTWLPHFDGGRSIEELLERRKGAALVVVDPDAGMPFDTWLRSLLPGAEGAVGTRDRPIVLVTGSEDGWTGQEWDRLLAAGATPVWLGPHVLRIETAALAAMAVAGTVLGSPPR